MTAPSPLNLRAMSDAWDDPVAFARELHKYYTQLEESGRRFATPDITQIQTEKERPNE